MKSLLCYILGHKWASMREVPNPHFHDCEWCKRCKKIKDLSKWRTKI